MQLYTTDRPEIADEVDYRVELDTYSGPLDLLLLLVRRHEIDLHDIPIAQLTDQYLRHLDLLKETDVNLAGEFLVMAATLLEIKSAMLLPPAHTEDDASDAPAEVLDPRHELVQQLLAYKRFKDAAFELDQRRHDWQSRFPRRPAGLGSVRGDIRAGEVELAADGAEQASAELIEIDLEDVHVLDLCQAFAQILQSIGRGPAYHEVVYDDTPIALHAEDILDRLQRDGPLTLAAIFVGRESRSELIGLFLATLELVRQRKLSVLQEQIGGPIELQLCEPDPAPPEDHPPNQAPDWRDPQTGEVQYEWPSEELRLRAQRRAKLRIERLKNRQFGPEQPDEEPLDEVISADPGPPGAHPGAGVEGPEADDHSCPAEDGG